MLLSSTPLNPRVRKDGDAKVDIYFSADVETDGPIPGPFSILSFALVYAGTFDGNHFRRPQNYDQSFYREMKPISDSFELEALQVNGLDREKLVREGEPPDRVMSDASKWIRDLAGNATPVMVAYPLCFDWTFLYWYFIRFSREGSPFGHSRCFDIKTAFALKAAVPMTEAGLSHLFPALRPSGSHTHNALDDAIEQAEIFANVLEWSGAHGRLAYRTS
jgi:hypothetical protein